MPASAAAGVASPRLANIARAVAARELALSVDGQVSTIGTAPSLSSGAGAPTHTRPIGSLYLRTDGAENTIIYINTDGAATWVAVPAGATASEAFTDTNNYFATDTIGAALVALGVAIGGATATTRDYSSQTYVADNDTLTVAIGKLDAALAAYVANLASTANGAGASDIGIEDSAARYTATNVETALAEVKQIADAVKTIADSINDQLVHATIAVTGGSGGATAGTLSLQLNRASASGDPIESARQVLIVATAAQYGPLGTPVNTVTFANATTGTLQTSGNGWALVLTNASGAFVCVPSDSADETIYFRVVDADGIDDQGERCVVVYSNSDEAIWAA